MSIVEKGLASTAGVGVSAARPDGKEKVKGNFLFSNDLSSEDMLWGQTLRSPHASAKIKGIDFSHALTIEGVHAVLTADDVPGDNIFGLEHPDQPVLAFDTIRYVGEPVAIIAANHPEVAKQAADSIVVDYEVLNPLVDSRKAIEANPIHPDGNIIRHLTIKHGDPDASGDFIVEGEYEVGMQDQAFLGTESGIAFPASDGGI